MRKSDVSAARACWIMPDEFGGAAFFSGTRHNSIRVHRRISIKDGQ